MNTSIMHDDRPVTGQLHSRVYQAIAGLALVFVLSAWSFSGSGYSDVSLVVVSGLFLVAIAIPATLWRIWRRNRNAEEQSSERSLLDWMSGEFDIWRGRLRASTAAAEILLPIAAVAFGMTAFGIVLHYVARAGEYH